MTRTTAITVAVVVTIVCLAVYACRGEISDRIAESYSNGRCFVCQAPLRHGDDVGSVRSDPTLGLAHFACLESAYGPLAE